MRPIPFDNSYQTLADSLFHRQQAEPVSSPQALLINTELAEALNIDSKWLASPAGIDVLSGNALAAGSQPIACVYAGHQFGNYNPQLGDGRALLLGEVRVAPDKAGRHRVDGRVPGAEAGAPGLIFAPRDRNSGRRQRRGWCRGWHCWLTCRER